MNIVSALKKQFPLLDHHPTTGNVVFQDDGDGPYIKVWKSAVLGAKPSVAEVDAMVSAELDPIGPVLEEVVDEPKTTA